MTVYAVRDGFQIPQKQSEVIAASLQRLSRRLGRPLLREDVLAEAAKAKSPLHRYFQWDDSIAARQYRLIQAGYLLRALEVTIDERGATPVRSMILVKPEGEPEGYVPTVDASAEMVRAQLARALRDAQSFYERYVAWRSFIEFQPMEPVMTAMEQAFGKS